MRHRPPTSNFLPLGGSQRSERRKVEKSEGLKVEGPKVERLKVGFSIEVHYFNLRRISLWLKMHG